MAYIRDLRGNEAKVQKKTELIDGIEFIFVKKTVTGKSVNMFLAYEASTGHMCGGGKTIDNARQHVSGNIEKIRAKLKQQGKIVKGLF